MPTLPQNIILVGFMGSGKSVVGGVLSRLTHRPLVDADDEIVRRAGKPIHQMFQDSGEAAFRDLERSVIQELCSTSGNIIAAGGGAFADPENQQHMLSGGLVFCLSARPKTIFQRIFGPASEVSEPNSISPPKDTKPISVPPSLEGTIGGSDQTVRPMLAGDDPLARIETLLAQRADAYSLAHFSIETDDLTPESAAERILELCRVGKAGVR